MRQVVRATEAAYQVQVTYVHPSSKQQQQQNYNPATLDELWRVVNREKAKPGVKRVRVMVEMACFDITTERTNG
jgi:hypothetical protein